MVLALKTSVKLEMCDISHVERLVTHLKSLGLPTQISDLNSDFTADILMNHMAQDKKVVEGNLVFILAKGIGKAEICKKVPLDLVIEVLNDDL